MKRKFYFKENFIGFIVGAFVFSVGGVLAVTYFPSSNTIYDNNNSGMTSTNVQDAVDELYEVCSAKPAGEQIIEDAGLIKDLYECRYFFTGANPNNYITFNNEMAGWRIMSVECDGTIKIIKNETIGKAAWSSLLNTWQNASLNTKLNRDYYNGLNSIAQNQIVQHNWSIGLVTYENNDLANQIYNENSEQWTGKIALPTVSEYIRSNSDQSSCGTFSKINDNTRTCQDSSWMVINKQWWTLSKGNITDRAVYIVSNNGAISSMDASYYNAYVGYEGRPSFYLSADIKITGGDGSQSNPYMIE